MSYSFQKEYTLKAQTPLIHFQPDMQGATLRATEVKPKLDRYIIKRADKDGKDISKWLIKVPTDKEDDAPKIKALNYKMNIQLTEKIEKIEKIPLGRKTPYDIYYGNMGNGNGERKGIKADCKLTITCFIEELRDYIDNIIGDFFVVTNFGTMQNKGFGSFLVEGTGTDNSYVCKTLKNEYQANACYHFYTYPDNVFKAIKCIYSLMKTGINFHSYRRSILFDYMHDSQKMDSLNLIDNEKAWLKQQRIAPNIGVKKEEYKNRKDKNSKYVRALFGISDSMSFKEKVDGDNNFVVNRKETSGVIERLPSPVFFKVINKTVYYVGMPINEEIYGKTFNFSSEWKEYGKEIVVPKKEELPNDFINDFMHYAYEKINGCDGVNGYKNDFKEIKNIEIKEE